MKKYKIIANPAAGRGRSRANILKTVELFKKGGAAFDLELTEGPGRAAEIARQAHSQGFDAVIVAGGDGTVNEAISGMLFSSVPLGIIPAGSGNDFIKSLNIPNNIEKAVDIVLAGRTKTIDVGRINGTYFANGVGIGFDAAVNEASYDINHSRRGLVLYMCALFRTLGRYRPVSLRISMPGSVVNGPLFLVTIGNGTTFGGGFRLAPHARVDDGLLDVTIISPISLPKFLLHLPKVFTGAIDRVRYTTIKRTRRLTVESEASVPVHVDGEIYDGNCRVFEIEVVPKALTVIGNF